MFLITEECREALLSSQQWLVEKMTVSDVLSTNFHCVCVRHKQPKQQDTSAKSEDTTYVVSLTQR